MSLLAGSSEIPPLRGIRAYPTWLIRTKVELKWRVRRPRHLIVYRMAPDGVAEILGLVHDRMVLSRAARSIVRGADKP